MPRPDDDRLRDLLDALEAITRFIEGLEEADFLADDLVASACAYQLLVVGEAAKGLTDEAKPAERHARFVVDPVRCRRQIHVPAGQGQEAPTWQPSP